MTALATDLRARVEALPGMDRLVPALAGLAPAHLVGGAVRDLLRGAGAVDLDVAVEGDAPEVARRLAERLGGMAVAHDRFGTATVRAPGLTVDLAATRRPAPASEAPRGPPASGRSAQVAPRPALRPVRTRLGGD